jgi:hypothetical protein
VSEWLCVCVCVCKWLGVCGWVCVRVCTCVVVAAGVISERLGQKRQWVAETDGERGWPVAPVSSRGNAHMNSAYRNASMTPPKHAMQDPKTPAMRARGVQQNAPQETERVSVWME